MGSTVAVTGRSGRFGSALRVLGWLIPFVGFLIAGWAWALSSPVGSSPDDDHHMASIWCPTPIESSGCLVGYDEQGYPIVKVPELIIRGQCYAFNPEISGECQLNFRGEAQTTRVDQGGYPGGYFDFVHIFVGPTVLKSVYSIRIFNVVAAALLILATVVVTPKSARLPLIGGAVVGVVPLGIFLIASLNPSSWAITGVCVAWGATHALLNSDSRVRRVLSSILIILGAAMAATSRADAGAYAIAVTVGYFVIQYRRSIPWISVVPIGMAGVIGSIGFLSGGQSGAALNDMGPDYEAALSGLRLLVYNIVDLPGFFAGMFGYQWGLGWLDTPMPNITAILMLTAIGGLVFLGTHRLSIRKIGTFIITLGAAVALALLVLQSNGIRVGTMVQPRYMLPLVIVFLMVLLVDAHHPGRSVELSTSNRWLLWIFVVIANIFALQRNIRRYTTGLDEDGFNLNRDVEWWVSSVSPMSLWIWGSIGFALFASAILFVGKTSKQVALEAPSERTISTATLPVQLAGDLQPLPTGEDIISTPTSTAGQAELVP